MLTVAVQDDTGNGIDPNELNQISAAMASLNQALGSFGVNLSWAAPGTDADVHLHFASSTPQGGASDGVLGFTTATNDVQVVTGWQFFSGDDASQISPNQYDFLTLATHELGHTVGLGESSDPGSVMYEYLTPGSVRRNFTESNLARINTDADRFMKVDLPSGVAQGEPVDQIFAMQTAVTDGDEHVLDGSGCLDSTIYDRHGDGLAVDHAVSPFVALAFIGWSGPSRDMSPDVLFRRTRRPK